jgi:hypothetical protein
LSFHDDHADFRTQKSTVFFACRIEKKVKKKAIVQYMMSIPTHGSYLSNCQFIIPTDNSDVGRVKISQQNLVVLAAERVSIKSLFREKKYIFFS